MKYLLVALSIVSTMSLSGCSNSTPQENVAEKSAISESATESGKAASADIESDSGKVEADADELLSQRSDELPVEANVASEEEKNQVLGEGWPQPETVLFLTGEQHGYIEPCGCTGLDNQKGGLIRRDTLLKELRAKGWDVVPVDAGNQVRRIGGQAVIKFNTTAESMKEMGYEVINLGIDDLKLPSVELIQIAGSDELNPGQFVSANVTILDPSFFPKYRVIESGGKKIGVTGIVAESHKQEIQSSDIELIDPTEALKPVMKELASQECDYKVLLAQASKEEAIEIVKASPEVDLVVIPGFGEPTLLPEKVPDSDAIMVQVGSKGMYAGIVGLFDDEENPVRYQRIAISSQFKDSERMLERFANYQQRLKEEGFENLGATIGKHPTGRQFVGSEVCGECHTTAFEIWEGTPHSHATDSIVAANNDRGGIARHYDPECVSCHATGWDVKLYYPYETGFLSPEETPAMVGSGCENCHGPGKAHVDAEYGDVDVDNATLEKLRQQMVLTLEQARESKCIECHDIDNSPGFHPVPENFDRFWEQVKHYGKE